VTSSRGLSNFVVIATVAILLGAVAVIYQQVQQPVPIWDQPLFGNILMGLIAALTAYILKKTANMEATLDAIKPKTDVTADKVAVIETHTNGMLRELQSKVDAASIAKDIQAVITKKDIEIAELKQPPKP
jgi:hypothetical protein